VNVCCGQGQPPNPRDFSCWRGCFNDCFGSHFKCCQNLRKSLVPRSLLLASRARNSLRTKWRLPASCFVVSVSLPPSIRGGGDISDGASLLPSRRGTALQPRSSKMNDLSWVCHRVQSIPSRSYDELVRIGRITPSVTSQASMPFCVQPCASPDPGGRVSKLKNRCRWRGLCPLTTAVSANRHQLRHRSRAPVFAA